jgi:hypothetical protein
MVIHAIRCGSAYDNYPQCHLLVDSAFASPTTQAGTSTGYNSISGYPEMNITVRSYPEGGLCAAAHHMTSLPSFISLFIMIIMVYLANMTRR